MLFRRLVDQLSTLDPRTYETLTLSQLIAFTTLSAEFLKRTNGVYGTGPTQIPIEFLTHCLDSAQPATTWASLWYFTIDALPTCLYDPTVFPSNGIPSTKRHKHAFTVPKHTFRPPSTHCLSCTSDNGEPVQLTMRKQLYGYLLNLCGIESVQSSSAYCRKCNCTYTPCYIRRGKLREYYTPQEGQLKDYFQVTQHFFMSHKLCDYLNNLHGLAVVSVHNLVIAYNHAHAMKDVTYSNDFGRDRFRRSMSENTCSLGLDLHHLMRLTNERGVRLKRNAAGSDDQQFHEAMEQHKQWVEEEGTIFPAHVCSLCTQYDPIPGTEDAKIIRAVVTDGVTIGHWACSASEIQLKSLDPNTTVNHCDKPLNKFNDRFCPEHKASLTKLCPAQPCINPIKHGQEMCGDPEHEAAHIAFKEQNSSFFGLPRRFTRPSTRIHHDPSVMLSADTGEVLLTPADMMYAEVEEREHEGARNGDEGCDKVPKFMLSRCRTHNEQLMVTPCGVIVARKTFFKSESVTKVKEWIREVYPDEMPQVIFYDNACGLHAHICTSTEDTHAFRNTTLPVDAFHIKSHKTTHTTCRLNNDPNLFPQLKCPDGSWRFNSSAAEIVNSWFGRFDLICRNMHSIKYIFFLEGMIRLHNIRKCAKVSLRANVTFFGNVLLKTDAL